MSRTIIFDVMGNDQGVKPPVLASLEFLKHNPNYKIILVGDKNLIKKYLNNDANIEILHNPNVATKSNDDLMRSYREDNSMNQALKLLKENKGDAVLSSGDSGKYLASSIMIVKRLENVLRPAFMSIIPTIEFGKKFLLLDEGANLNTTEQYLIQWAKLGAAFSKSILKVKNPKVSILNIGEEDYKGYEYHQKAHQILKNSKNNFEYQGFIESKTLLEGKCDVVVADGFSGNTTLKCLEGTILSFMKLMKKIIYRNIWSKICAFLMKKTFNDLKEYLDYRNVGAAWIIGLNGIVIKAHGGSDQKAYLGALNQIKSALENNTLEEFKKALSENNEKE